MKFGINTYFRKGILVLLCLFLYSISFIVLMQNPEFWYGNKFVQILLVYVLLCLLSIPILLHESVINSAALILSSTLSAFIANVSGPDIGVLLPVILPLLLIFAITLQYPLSIASSILLYIMLISALQAHSAWGRQIPGIDMFQISVLAGAGLIISCTGLFMRQQSIRISVLQQERDRLDEAYRKLTEANLDFQTYALFAREEAIEDERKRLAGELHDIIGYTLTNLIMLIQAAQYGKGGPEETGAILEKARLHADASLRDARQALSALRAREIDRPKGPQLFLRLVHNFEDITGVRIHIDFTHFPSELDLQSEKLIYRIIQEGLTNAFRHGKASEVVIHFWAKQGYLILTLRDNGKEANNGTRSGKESSGIGLMGLKELTSDLGGILVAHPVEDGFLIHARIPLEGTKE